MSNLSVKVQLLGLGASVALSFSVAAIGAVASARAGAFYQQLSRPMWAPPAEVFGPVWTALYLLMGIAAWLVWRKDGFEAAKGALTVYFIQLTLNAVWSWLFFRWHQGLWSVIDIVLLWGVLLATVIAFWRQTAWAGVLLIPYWLWVSYASALNFTLWRMNPDLL